MRDSCSEFAAGVAKSFAFLFKRGFRIEFQQSLPMDTCLIILGSGKFRIKLYRTIDEVNLQVGTSSVPPVWETTSDGETRWYFLRSIVGFLTNDITPTLPDAAAWATRTHAVQIEELSAMLRAHFRQIEELFGEGRFKSARQAYDRYVETARDAVRKQYAANAKKPD